MKGCMLCMIPLFLNMVISPLSSAAPNSDADPINIVVNANQYVGNSDPETKVQGEVPGYGVTDYGAPEYGYGALATEIEGCTAITKCVLPFKYLNVSYAECTSVDEAAPWCATSVDDSGEMTDYAMCYESAQKCMFPFTYKDVTYDGCTTTESEYAGYPWCTFATDANGRGDRLKWGFCNADCPVSSGCQFPFVSGGITYDSCTDFESVGEPWCSTKNYENGTMIGENWKLC